MKTYKSQCIHNGSLCAVLCGSINNDRKKGADYYCTEKKSHCRWLNHHDQNDEQLGRLFLCEWMFWFLLLYMLLLLLLLTPNNFIKIQFGCDICWWVSSIWDHRCCKSIIHILSKFRWSGYYLLDNLYVAKTDLFLLSLCVLILCCCFFVFFGWILVSNRNMNTTSIFWCSKMRFGSINRNRDKISNRSTHLQKRATLSMFSAILFVLRIFLEAFSFEMILFSYKHTQPQPYSFNGWVLLPFIFLFFMFLG